MSSVHWQNMDDDALKLAAFGEGIPPSSPVKTRTTLPPPATCVCEGGTKKVVANDRYGQHFRCGGCFATLSKEAVDTILTKVEVPNAPVQDTNTITVYMDSEKTQSPFGMFVTAPFLELFWRETGADCDGEEECLVFPDGKKYRVTLHDTVKNETKLV